MKRSKRKSKSLSITLAGLTFSSWNKARTYFGTVIKKHKQQAIECGPPYRVVIGPNNTDFAFVKCMFNLLSSKRSKLGGEKLQCFEIAPEHGDVHNASGNWCCYVVNSVGKKEKWSVRTIGQSKKKTESDLQKSVFRMEISYQRDEWARQFPYLVECEQCQTQLTNTLTKQPKVFASGNHKRPQKANIDHDVQNGQAFITSYTLFQSKLRGQNTNVKWSMKYGRKVPRLQDRNVARAWQRYHKKKTVFRFLCTKCNQQSDNKAPRKK